MMGHPVGSIIVDLPGHLGFKKRRIEKRLNDAFGPGHWNHGFLLEKALLSYDQALQLYEDSYYQFLQANPHIVDDLVSRASDVFDTNPSNVRSGLDYSKQEGLDTHLQDVAIRRALRRLGREFYGTRLLQVRGPASDLPFLSPGVVPFVKPEAILDRRFTGLDWVSIGSIEDFWCTNKVIAVAADPGVAEHVRQKTEAILAGRSRADARLLRYIIPYLSLVAPDREIIKRAVGWIASFGSLERERAAENIVMGSLCLVPDFPDDTYHGV